MESPGFPGGLVNHAESFEERPGAVTPLFGPSATPPPHTPGHLWERPHLASLVPKVAPWKFTVPVCNSTPLPLPFCGPPYIIEGTSCHGRILPENRQWGKWEGGEGGDCRTCSSLPETGDPQLASFPPDSLKLLSEIPARPKEDSFPFPPSPAPANPATNLGSALSPRSASRDAGTLRSAPPLGLPPALGSLREPQLLEPCRNSPAEAPPPPKGEPSGGLAA